MKSFKAGALYYAIFVSFFIVLITGFMVLQRWYQHYYIIYEQQRERLERNLKSAILEVTLSPALLPADETKTLDLYGDSIDMVGMSKKWWGGYQIIRAEASWRVIKKTRIELVGTETLPGDVIALYLADDGKYLSLAGSTQIKGNCFLPKLGVRKAYIEGTGFTGNKLIDGEVKDSKESLPVPDSAFIIKNRLANQERIAEYDSIIDIAFLIKTGTISNSFYNKTVKFNTSSWLTLDNKNLKGNIKIVSQKGITIKNTTKVQDVILYAPKIVVDDKFTGSLQCFVTDTLLVGKGCLLKYPSLMVLNETNIDRPTIKINENTTLLGDIVLLAKTDKLNVLPECILNKNVVLNGSVYCNGKVYLQGFVKGQLFCKGFILRTESSVYENHLMNSKINSALLSAYYAGAMYHSTSKLQKTIKCLH